MRKKLDIHFSAPRIKKIMQADEDVGKIALAVPVLVSKALELFLQDLCDRTYDITIRKGVKTVGSSHLKQCIQTYNVYDFLRDVVSKVPDTGTSDAIADDKLGKRRKSEEDGSDEELKRTRNDAESLTSNGRGHGRGRGRGRRGGRGAWREAFTTHEQFVENQSSKPAGLKVEVANEVSDATEAKEATPVTSARACLRNIDLNLDPVDEDEVAVPPQTQSSAPATNSAAANLELTAPATSSAAANLGLTAPATSSSAATAGPSVPRSKEGAKLKEFLGGWELPDMNKMDVDPAQFALSSNHKLDDDEDYDNED
ncbi:dr1-associated corepressor homolog isoform X2 [Panicum virgatum]|uniref:dr1-associated corepressor homolog isoform X2 n=1 Tax=Panicum virgatum TaxID=38727 RepID=UPI0019D5A24A|nr:dr1-associated corepressor homolog isoform X2 [Panicum virgatum]